MNVKDLYETITTTAPTTQNTFFTHLDTTVRYLIGRYGMAYTIEKSFPYVKPDDLEDDIPLYDEYYPAVCDNILYLLTGDNDRKTDFVEEAENAYLTVWRVRARGKKILDRGYY